MLVTSCKYKDYATLLRMITSALGSLESGMHCNKTRILGKKRWGKRFQAFLAEIAVRSSGDPLIELLTFFFFRHFKAKTGE